MRLAVTFLGLDLFTIEVTQDDDANDTDPGESTSYPVGFTASPGDQAWQSGVER